MFTISPCWAHGLGKGRQRGSGFAPATLFMGARCTAQEGQQAVGWVVERPTGGAATGRLGELWADMLPKQKAPTAQNSWEPLQLRPPLAKSTTLLRNPEGGARGRGRSRPHSLEKECLWGGCPDQTAEQNSKYGVDH